MAVKVLVGFESWTVVCSVMYTVEIEDTSCTVTVEVEGVAVKKTVLILGAQVSAGSRLEDISIDQIEARVNLLGRRSCCCDGSKTPHAGEGVQGLAAHLDDGLNVNVYLS